MQKCPISHLNDKNERILNDNDGVFESITTILTTAYEMLMSHFMSFRMTF